MSLVSYVYLDNGKSYSTSFKFCPFQLFNWYKPTSVV